MGSGSMIYIPSKDWFIYSKVNGGGYTDTQTGRRSPKPTLGKYSKNEHLLFKIY
jgi:hypothetical protein